MATLPGFCIRPVFHAQKNRVRRLGNRRNPMPDSVHKPERFPAFRAGCAFGAFAFQSFVGMQSFCLRCSRRAGELRRLFLRPRLLRVSCIRHPNGVFSLRRALALHAITIAVLYMICQSFCTLLSENAIIYLFLRALASPLGPECPASLHMHMRSARFLGAPHAFVHFRFGSSPAPPISAVISSMRSNGNGGSQRGFIAMLMSFMGLSSAATRLELSAPHRLQR